VTPGVPLLELRGVSRRLASAGRTLTVVDAVDLRVERREMVAVLGPSGSGKSTLLGLMAGLDRPSAGEVRIDGVRLSDLSEDDLALLRRDKIGFVFQSFHLLGHLTALENVLLPLELAGRRKARMRAEELLAEVGLEDREHHYPVQLSGGEQQRVAVARAFAAEPDLLLADEPTGSLDRTTGRSLLALFHRLHRRRDAGAVVVTHDPEVAALADRRIHLLDGRVQPAETGTLG
jgi:putative ABC transport system ATP-binding protein